MNGQSHGTDDRSADAAAPPAFKRTELQRAASPVAGWEIVQTLVEIPEGISSGRHSHPGPEVGFIARGDVSMEFDDGTALELHTGSPFLIPPGVIHNAVNVGTVTTMMLSTYFIDETKPLSTLF
jgi:quercetin dioxygenase-like cupin family protein